MSHQSPPPKQIAKNTLLFYFRMLFMMVVSLYTNRVILNALGWRTLEYISVNRKHIFKFVSLCKFNTIHIKQLKRKTYILCQTKHQIITSG